MFKVSKRGDEGTDSFYPSIDMVVVFVKSHARFNVALNPASDNIKSCRAEDFESFFKVRIVKIRAYVCRPTCGWW
ncbi:MAG: hypothetical protein HYY92_03380 [Parcubacteria group bacterium]|nr:hypothetical protein [Parcubacteria group bacterium]